MTRLLALALACFLALTGPALAERRIASAVHEVEPVLHEWGYAAVAGAATLDFLGVPVPAVTILVEDHAASAPALVHAGRPWLLPAAALAVLALVALAFLRHGGRAGTGSP